jgi:GNAT superfamily N-acetyltransferase
MTIDVFERTDAHEAFERARGFLFEHPAHHNLPLSILRQSRDEGLAGRYWIVEHDGCVVGFALQSPPGMRVVLALMDAHVVQRLADAIAPPLPGVTGEAAAATAFAGRFGLAHHVAVVDPDPGRLFELTRVASISAASGGARPAAPADRELVARWLAAFAGDTDDPGGSRAMEEVDRRIASGAFWLWDDGDPVCLVGTRDPVAGYARIGPVYTPPDRRGHGYATACVAHASRVFVDAGVRCVLYTQLSNPTANAIYHRIGYQPIGEVVAYGFG